MINLYSGNETNFDHFGMILKPTVAKTRKMLNGLWSLSMTVPYMPGISNEMIVKADGNLYRIKKIKKTGVHKNQLHIYAELKALDDLNSKVMQLQNSNCSAFTFISSVFDGLPYTVSSSVFTSANVAVSKMTKRSKVLGGYIGQYGEISFSMNEVNIVETLGNINGPLIDKFINLKGIDFDEDTTQLVTKLHYSNNDGSLTGTAISPHVNAYSTIYEDYKQFSASTQEELDKLAGEYLESKHLPYVHVSIDIADLSKSIDLKKRGIAHLKRIRLGDTLPIRHPELDIFISARVIEIEEDLIGTSSNHVVLSNYSINFFTALTTGQKALSKTEEIESVVDNNNIKIIKAEESLILQAARIDGAEASIVFQADQISSKVSKTTVISDINSSLEQAKIGETLLELTNTNGAINAVDSKVDANSADILTLLSRVVNAETNISQNSYDINLKAEQSIVNTLSNSLGGVETRVTSAEASINVNANAITNKVSSTDYNGNIIASKINQTASDYSIDALKIYLLGIVQVANTLTLGDDDTAGRIDFTSGCHIKTYNAGMALEAFADYFNFNLNQKLLYKGKEVATQEYVNANQVARWG